jgi:hypothetical protein
LDIGRHALVDQRIGDVGEWLEAILGGGHE